MDNEAVEAESRTFTCHGCGARWSRGSTRHCWSKHGCHVSYSDRSSYRMHLDGRGRCRSLDSLSADPALAISVVERAGEGGGSFLVLKVRYRVDPSTRRAAVSQGAA